jgi:dihydroxyacetone kinase-like protein
VFVHKLAGALAEQRKPLSEIKSTLERILNSCKNLRTIGVSLSGSVPLPGAEKTPTSQNLESNQIEIGMGIHGENGRHRMGLGKSSELMKYLLDEYLFKNKTENQKEQQFCLMVNNLGGLSVLESYVIVNDCVRYITEQKLGKVVY